MNFLQSLLPTAFVLGILILIHEFGHFLACRLSGVKVEKFSIGFGPEILHIQGKETRYVISLLPLGGYVKPAGESVSELETEAPKPGDYLAAPIFSRIFIVVAGVLMNYFLAYVLFTGILIMGRPVPGTTVGTFVDGYPAQTSGLQLMDKIVQVNDQKVSNWMNLTDAFQSAPSDSLNLRVERKNPQGSVEFLTFPLVPREEKVKDIFGKEMTVRRVGIMPHPQANEFERFGFIESAQKAWEIMTFQAGTTYKALFYLVMGKLSMKTLAGPIGIVSMTGSAAQLGLVYVLQLTATLSVSLAVINLIPIPGLDGGHLLFLLIEAVRRKKVSLETQERFTQVGVALLMVLMVFIVYNDLNNMQVFEKVKSLFHLTKS